MKGGALLIGNAPPFTVGVWGYPTMAGAEGGGMLSGGISEEENESLSGFLRGGRLAHGLALPAGDMAP